MADQPALRREVVALASMKPHPRNYRTHPPEQLAHIEASLRQHGVYRNVVVTADGTILAGHGVVEAARRIGLDSLPVVVLPIAPDSPAALQVLVGDNLISHLAVDDDRALTGMLKQILAEDNLLGTGYDEKLLAALALVTRPATEIADATAAAKWVGTGDVPVELPVTLVVSFRSPEDRAEFVKTHSVEVTRSGDGPVWAARPLPEEAKP